MLRHLTLITAIYFSFLQPAQSHAEVNPEEIEQSKGNAAAYIRDAQCFNAANTLLENYDTTLTLLHTASPNGINVVDYMLGLLEKHQSSDLTSRLLNEISSRTSSPTSKVLLEATIDRPIDYRPQSILESIMEAHRRTFAFMKNLIKSLPADTATLQELTNAIRALDKEQYAHLQMMHRLGDIDNAAIHALHVSEIRLAKNQADLKYLLTDQNLGCDPTLFDDTITNALADIAAWLTALDHMKLFISIGAQKRDAVFTHITQSTRDILNKRYAHLVRQEISSVQADVNNILRVDRFSDKLSAWWDAISQQGLTNGLQTKYLQYHQAKAILRNHKITLSGFKDEFASLPPLPRDAKDYLTKRLSFIEAEVENAHQKLQLNGWLGVFKRQKFLVHERLARIEKFAPTCLPAISAYQNDAEHVTTEQGFKNLESLYMIVVDACVARRP